MTVTAEAEPRIEGAPLIPRTALVPLDFSDCSLAGLEAARVLARRLGVRLELVHIDGGPPAWLSQNEGSPSELAAIQEYYLAVKERLQEAAAPTPGALCRLLDGAPEEVLPPLAAGRPADLIVMGSHGYRGLSRLVHGSTAEAVVHASAVPVLTVHSLPGPDWPRRILVPMKFADYADPALFHALEWGRALGAGVSVVHVIMTEDAEREEVEALDGHLERLLGPKRFRGLERILSLGPPADTILKTVEGGAFDLVVLAAHFKPFWRELVLGSTTERVVRASKVPVLAVPGAGGPLPVD